MNLRTEGGIKALLGIVRCGHPDVLSQVARGIANFAKCESRASAQGNMVFLIRLKKGRFKLYIAKSVFSVSESKEVQNLCCNF